MAVYVDNARIPFRGMLLSHMVADTVDELQVMAREIGLSSKWFQHGHTSLPHYDVSVSKRKLAISLGAKEISSREIVGMMRKRRKKNGNTK